MSRGCFAWILVWPALVLLIAVTSWFGSHHMPVVAVVVFAAGCAGILWGLAPKKDDNDH